MHNLQSQPEMTREIRVVFDSSAEKPAARGLLPRITTRHLLYEVGDLCVDLHVDRNPMTGRYRLVGQLADQVDPLTTLAGVRVQLVADGEVIAETTSDRFGEFLLHYVPSRSMQLRAVVSGDGPLEVPIDRRVAPRWS